MVKAPDGLICECGHVASATTDDLAAEAMRDHLDYVLEHDEIERVHRLCGFLS